jgi:hypothetical protein
MKVNTFSCAEDIDEWLNWSFIFYGQSTNFSFAKKNGIQRLSSIFLGGGKLNLLDIFDNTRESNTLIIIKIILKTFTGQEQTNV